MVSKNYVKDIAVHLKAVPRTELSCAYVMRAQEQPDDLDGFQGGPRVGHSQPRQAAVGEQIRRAGHQDIVT